ncbi:hypothetical protein V1477_008214 [Vespula maculifrons]
MERKPERGTPTSQKNGPSNEKGKRMCLIKSPTEERDLIVLVERYLDWYLVGSKRDLAGNIIIWLNAEDEWDVSVNACRCGKQVTLDARWTVEIIRALPSEFSRNALARDAKLWCPVDVACTTFTISTGLTEVLDRLKADSSQTETT